MEAIDLNQHLVSQFNHYQAMLFPFAYNITGDAMAAEDIVQEVLNNQLLNSSNEITNPKHYLIRSVINRSINEKKLLRNKMEEYRGKWLPVPVLTEENIYAGADREKILHYSLLVVLEKLSAKERAVFILKETFDFDHDEIADLLKIKVDHSRQLLKRGKEKILPDAIKTVKINPQNQHLLQQLKEAISSSDIEKTKYLLSNDVECTSDGGSKVRAATNMLVGKDSVSKFLRAIYGKYFPAGASSHVAIINHHPAIVFSLDKKIFRCMVLEIEGKVIRKVFIIVNPDKLQHLQFI